MQFEYTYEGYKLAVKYLISIDRLKDIEKELSVDGFTTVALANSIYDSMK